MEYILRRISSIVVDQFEFHINDIDIVLVYLLLVLQNLVTCAKFTEF